MRILFWTVQIFVAALALVPLLVLVVLYPEALREFLPWVGPMALWVGLLSLGANLLRRRGWIVAGTLLLLPSLLPYLVILWFIASFAQQPFH